MALVLLEKKKKNYVTRSLALRQRYVLDFQGCLAILYPGPVYNPAHSPENPFKTLPHSPALRSVATLELPHILPSCFTGRPMTFTSLHQNGFQASFSLFIKYFVYLFTWLQWVIVAACRTFLVGAGRIC